MTNKAYASYTITDLIDGLEWKGALSGHPDSPKKSWAYYNTSDKKSYIYTGEIWTEMTYDGADAEIWYVVPSATSIKRTPNENGNGYIYSPDKITVSYYKQIGSNSPIEITEGEFGWTNGKNVLPNSPSTEITAESLQNNKTVYFYYRAASTDSWVLWDWETFETLEDGSKGEQGPAGTVTGSLTFYCATNTDVFAPDSSFLTDIDNNDVAGGVITSTSNPPVNWYSESRFFGTEDSLGAWDTRLEEKENDDGRPSKNPCVWSITLIRSQVGEKWFKAHDPLKVSLMTAATMAARIQISDDLTNPILNTENMKVATWCGREELSLIDGSAIVANSITANQIKAGTISTAQLAADAITAEKLAVNAITSRNYYKKDEDGNPTEERSEKGMAINLEHGTLDSLNFKVNQKGEITAIGGTVGGWSIKEDMLSASSSLGVGLYMGSPSGFPEYFGESLIASNSLSPVRFFCGCSSQINDAKFMVLEDGSLYATAARFTGANVSFDDNVQVNTGSGTSTTLGAMSNTIISLNGTISNLNNIITELQGQIEELQGRVTGVEKEKDMYGVYFHPNGGSFADGEKQKFVEFNENKTVDLSKVSDPIREHYRFTGWFTKPSGGDQISSETVFDVATTVTVYAHWEQKEFKITLTTYTDPDYEEEMWTNDNGQLAGPLPTLTEIAPGDRFLGWYSSNKGGTEIDTNTVFSKDTTIYAHWQFAIQFNKLNESSNSVFIEWTAEDGSGKLSSIPSLPDWENSTDNTEYYCNGWYTQQQSGGTKITTSYQFTNSTTVYAQWREGAQWTITFDPQGGTLQGSSSTMQTEMSGKLNFLPTAVLIKNEFIGWFTHPSGGVRITTDTIFTQNTTVYAHWKDLSNIYTITFYNLVLQDNQYVYVPHSEKYETEADGTWSGNLPNPEAEIIDIYDENSTHYEYEFNGWYTDYKDYIGNAQDYGTYSFGRNVNIYASYTLKKIDNTIYSDLNQDNIVDDDYNPPENLIIDWLRSAIEGSNGDIDIDGRNINCSQTLKYTGDEQGWVYTDRQEDWYSTLPVPITHWVSTLRPSYNTYIIYLNKENGNYNGCRISRQHNDAQKTIFVLPPSTDFYSFRSQVFIAGGIEIWYNSDSEETFGNKLNALECSEDWIVGRIEGDTILVTSFDSNGNFLAQEQFDVVYDPSLSK